EVLHKAVKFLCSKQKLVRCERKRLTRTGGKLRGFVQIRAKALQAYDSGGVFVVCYVSCPLKTWSELESQICKMWRRPDLATIMRRSLRRRLRFGGLLSWVDNCAEAG
ncbi:MAG: hypothetical protein ACYSP9_06730, partial [Planctomycetota bacterium]